MKNNNQHHQIRQARADKLHKAVLVQAEVAQNTEPIQVRRRRRRVNYAKKIMNDPFIFTV